MRGWTRTGILAGLCAPLALGVGASGGAEEVGDTPRLAVVGNAELERPADELRMTFAVVSEGDSATTASAENASRMKSVLSALEAKGLGDDEISTSRFSVQPRYSQRPRNAEADWTPRIVGYRVENAVAVTTQKLDQAGELIEAAIAAGANRVDSLTFGLADERVHRAAAIEQATARARADAAALAEAAGVRLDGILSLQLDGASAPPVRRQPMMALASAEAAPPIEPGEVTVRARVNVVYRIAEK